MKFLNGAALLFVLFIGINLVSSPARAAGICEASGTARCFYIDPAAGSDSNNGAFATPWKTFANIMSYYNSSWRPAGWMAIQPGDYIYLRAGVHNSIRVPGDGTGQTGGTRAIAYFRTWPSGSQSGTQTAPIHLKSYPGERAVLGDIETEPYTYGLYLLASEWWEVSDIEFRNIPATCVNVSGGANHKFFNLEVHDCARKDTDGNPAGIKLTGVKNTETFNSKFYDTFWDPRLVPQNPLAGSWFLRGIGIQMFQGYNHTIHHNVFLQTKQGKDINGNDAGYPDCIMQKHAQETTDGYLRIYNNEFSKCRIAIASGTQNTWAHHNTIVDSTDPVRVADFGGITYQVNQLYEYNTIYGSHAFGMHPSTTPYNNLFPVLPKNITFRNNIVYDTTTTYTNERNMVDVYAYISDALYDATVPELHFSNNCYFNANGLAPRFAIGAANNGGTYGVKGAVYSWAQWQTLSNNGIAYNQDRGSLIANPLFVNAAGRDFHLQSGSSCSAMGVHAGTAATVPPSAPKGLLVN